MKKVIRENDIQDMNEAEKNYILGWLSSEEMRMDIGDMIEFLDANDFSFMDVLDYRNLKIDDVCNELWDACKAVIKYNLEGEE